MRQRKTHVNSRKLPDSRGLWISTYPEILFCAYNPKLNKRDRIIHRCNNDGGKAYTFGLTLIETTNTHNVIMTM